MVSMGNFLDYTPVGFLSNLASTWFGLGDNPAARLLNGASDKMFGTTFGQEALSDKQFGQNRILAQEERTWQEQMYERMMQDQSPAAMMQKYREAGLNPNLAYGNLATGAVNPPSAGAASVGLAQPQYSAVNPLLGAEIDLKEALASESRAKAGEIQTLLPFKTKSFQISYDNAVKDLDVKVENILRSQHERGLLEEKIKSESFYRDLSSRQYDLENNKYLLNKQFTEQQLKNMQAELDKILADTKVTKQQYNEMVATFATRFYAMKVGVKVDEAKIDELRATAKHLGIEDKVMEQLLNMRSPDELRSLMKSSALKDDSIFGILTLSLYGALDMVTDLIPIKAGTKF